MLDIRLKLKYIIYLSERGEYEQVMTDDPNIPGPKAGVRRWIAEDRFSKYAERLKEKNRNENHSK